MGALIPQLDQSGGAVQWVRTYLGPTIGWVHLPVQPARKVSSAASPVTVGIGDYGLLVTTLAAPLTINLPSVTEWVQQSIKTHPQMMLGSLELSLWIKDMTGNAPANNITIQPFGPDTIDALVATPFKIIQARQLLRLYPMPDLSGWFSG